MNATPEEWRPVVGFEDRYEVSNHGRVRSRDYVARCRAGKTRTGKGRILALSLNSNGYPRVTLGRGNGRKVHALVLEAFVGERPEGMDCCHNDGNPTNNHVDNLRWDTRASNINDAVRHGTHANAAKTHCPNGHEYTPENTYVHPRKGGRECRTCGAEQIRMWQRLHRGRAAK